MNQRETRTRNSLSCAEEDVHEPKVLMVFGPQSDFRCQKREINLNNNNKKHKEKKYDRMQIVRRVIQKTTKSKISTIRN